MTRSNNGFSFQRLRMVALYYYPILKKQLWLYPAISLAAGILTFMLGHFAEYMGLSGFVSGIIMTAMMFMLYWGPCILGNDGREIEISLPALWSEKAAFLIGYFFIVVPALIFVPYMLNRILLMSIFTPEMPLFEIQRYGYGWSVAGTNIGIGSIESLVVVSTALFVMISSRRRNFARGAVLSIVALIGLGVVSGIIAVARVFSVGFDKITGYAESEDIAGIIDSMSIESIVAFIATICAAYVVLMIVLTARSIRKIQI